MGSTTYMFIISPLLKETALLVTNRALRGAGEKGQKTAKNSAKSTAVRSVRRGDVSVRILGNVAIYSALEAARAQNKTTVWLAGISTMMESAPRNALRCKPTILRRTHGRPTRGENTLTGQPVSRTVLNICSKTTAHVFGAVHQRKRLRKANVFLVMDHARSPVKGRTWTGAFIQGILPALRAAL